MSSAGHARPAPSVPRAPGAGTPSPVSFSSTTIFPLPLRKGPRESGFCFLFLIYSFSSTGRTQGLNTLQVSSLRRSAALASEDTAPTFTFSRSRWNTVREKVKPAGHEQSRTIRSFNPAAPKSYSEGPPRPNPNLQPAQGVKSTDMTRLKPAASRLCSGPPCLHLLLSLRLRSVPSHWLIALSRS